MQDNATSHASKFTKSWLEEHGLVGDRYMDWPPNSCNLNPIENLWAIIKADIYKENRQFFSMDDLWKAIQEAFSAVTPSQIRVLNQSVDRRLMAVLKGKGGYTKYWNYQNCDFVIIFVISKNKKILKLTLLIDLYIKK